MKLLVTAGNTMVLIDQVRCLTNIFTGRTGAAIAAHAHGRGHDVTLLTSHPETVAGPAAAATDGRWRVLSFRTFEDLQRLMAQWIPARGLDAVIHCAAVSDYGAGGVYAPAPGSHFRPDELAWQTADGSVPRLVDRAAGKVKSDQQELWLRLVRLPKLIDFIRTEWGFGGVLVKFKLEVGVSDEELLAIAENSRVQSAADLMVANTLEGAAAWAYVGPLAGRYERVQRGALPARLIAAVEKRHQERTHG